MHTAQIIYKEILTPEIKRIKIEAPHIAQKARAGQFVVVIVEEKGERFPLTLADWSKEKQTITLIFQEVGFSTKELGKLNVGDSIFSILGPLGNPTNIEKPGTVVCIGGGVGIAEIFSVSRAFKEVGNKVIGIMGSRTKDLLILEKEMKEVCDELYITTDDGSYGQKGLVSDVLNNLLKQNSLLSTYYSLLIYAIGPVPMMQAVSELTRPYKIKTIVNLNPIMVDATGMCGACRVSVGSQTKFACVDGPEFDGHLVDFQQLRQRLNLFSKQEKEIKILDKGCKLH